MGVVWRAIDTELGRVVAVKHASPGLGVRGAEWLRREAKNAARVQHPNAVTLFDAVREDTDCWLVMEYVPADSLATTVDRHGPLDPGPAARIAEQVAAALAAMHAGGILHRDVKPGNVLVTEHGVAKLTDFGISRWAEETLTPTGPAPGTPAYQAPEVAAGQPATAASDVYSLGATLFAIVEGVPPGDNHLVVARAGVLGDALGALLAPDPARRPTAEAARAMLGAFAGDPAVPVPIAVPVPHEPAGPTPRQLPAAPASFIGRQEELGRLDSALGDGTATISAVSGAGGIGKTWLALAWAHRNLHRFPDGQLFADLRGFSPTGRPAHPVDVLGGFLVALGVERDDQPTDPDRRAELYRSLVADKRMLVVLDNAATTDQITPLLPGGHRCAVVVTSRNQLRGLVARHSARPVHLDVLTDSEARTLLAATVGPDADTHAIAELIELCGGFPLALGVITAHVATSRHLPLRDTVAELRTLGMDALGSEEPTASLPTVLSWSLRRLTPRQREVFALLGVSPGPDTGLPAVARLAGLSERDAHAVLRALADASLVDRTPGGRYGMHDLVRAYATSVADGLPAEVRETAVRRVLDFYAGSAHHADLLLNPQRDPVGPPASHVEPQPLHDGQAALAWLDVEHAGLLAAQHTAATAGAYITVWYLAWGLHTFHYRRGHRHDRLTAWQAAVDAVDHLPDPVLRTLAHQYLGHAHAELDHHDAAITHLHHARAVAEEHGDLTHQAQAHNALAGAWGRQGDDRKALEHARHALELQRGLDDPLWEAEALNAVGWYAARLGDHDTARDHCEAALVLHRRLHHQAGEAGALDSLGFIEHGSGNHARAIDHYRAAITLLHELDYSYHLPTTLDALGHPHAALGEYEQARAVWLEALELYREQGRDGEATRLRQRLDDLGGSSRNTEIP